MAAWRLVDGRWKKAMEEEPGNVETEIKLFLVLKNRLKRLGFFLPSKAMFEEERAPDRSDNFPQKQF